MTSGGYVRFSKGNRSAAHRRTGRRRALAIAGALTVGVAGLTTVDTAPAQANPFAEGYGNLLASQVNAGNVSKHLREFQAIADRNGGNRALGSRGYIQSVEYVERQLRSAGFAPRRQELTTVSFQAKSHSLTAGGATIESDVFSMSGATKQITAPVAQVPASDTTPGCSVEDFSPETNGAIAVVERGVCPFGDKATNAKKAGAKAIVIINNKDEDLGGGTLGDVQNAIPALGVSKADGAAVRSAGQLTLAVDTEIKRIKTWNVIAETYSGWPDSVVMVGAHLDGVPEGPGVNDNGSGTAGVLQAAKSMTAFAPVKNKVRFAFWGAEEQGLIGSTHYVEGLSPADRGKIKRYLNFDMIGSHNGGYFVYDGDGSAHLPGAYPGPAGSGELERVMIAYLARKGVKPEVSGFDGRSDYDAFAQAGIASGGLDSGADKKKTPAQAAKWGGTPGEIFDQNYHTDRDTFGNVNQKVLGVLAPGVAYAAGYFAMA